MARPLTSSVAAALAAALLAVLVAPPAGAEPPEHLPPVDAPVVDPFRPPAQAWQSGNRGLEYGTPPGTVVRATADGTVVFAGTVAGTRHVTVRHAGDLRTSYSFLDRIEVVVGQRVEQGAVVGTTAGALHLGARRGAVYFDPASLFTAGPVAVRLVPFEDPPGRGGAGERSALRQLVGGLGWLAERAADRVLEPTGATVDWLRDNGIRLLRSAGHYLEPLPIRVARRAVDIWRDARTIARRPCSAPGTRVTPPTERRIAVTVGGLGSTDHTAAIDDVDERSLGYRPGDIVRFSYAGGRTPATGAAFPDLPTSSYGSADTQGDIERAGARLADLIDAVAAAAPGTTIDVLAHSLGGLVARVALVELASRHGPTWLDRLGLVATLGTPHGGADLATGVDAVGSSQRGSQVFDAALLVLRPGIDDDAPVVGQLAETSSLVRGLADEPVPPGVDLVSIAARGDITVPVPRTEVPGGAQVVVPVDGPGAHDALPGSPEAAQELHLALAGRPPTCRSFEGALLDQAVGEAISLGEDTIAGVAWLALARHGQPLGG